MDLLQAYRGLRGKELAFALLLTPVLIPIWLVLAILKPIHYVYDEAMTRFWGGR